MAAMQTEQERREHSTNEGGGAPSGGGRANGEVGESAGGTGDFLAKLPNWMQPGVSPMMHIFLRVVLVSLNSLLLYCSVRRVMTPHFEIMFVLSLGLTICYFIFMSIMEDLRLEAAKAKHGENSTCSTASTAVGTSCPSGAGTCGTPGREESSAPVDGRSVVEKKTQ